VIQTFDDGSPVPSDVDAPGNLRQLPINGHARPAEIVRPKYALLADAIPQLLRPVGRRLTTGWTTLDDALRGGLPVGRVMALIGAPGSGKTGVAVGCMDRWERQGCACVYVAADEPAAGIVTRLGQQDGWSRDALESDGDIGAAVRAGFVERSRGRAVVVVDPDADDGPQTLEEAAEVLFELASGRTPVLFVDSLQTVRCAAAELAENSRDRMDAIVRVCKAIARRGALVVEISEMSRGGYRTGDRGTDISALAAGKESSSIEYGAAVVPGLRSVRGEHNLVDVEVAKNRLGGAKPELRLKLDPDRATFQEVERPANESTGRTSTAEPDARALLQIVLKQPGMGTRDLRAAIRGAGHSWGVPRVDAAQARLASGVDGYRLVNRSDNPRAARWHVERGEEASP
jgi:KaiC/GvpD/RAD55 family RecA-like ATPase